MVADLFVRAGADPVGGAGGYLHAGGEGDPRFAHGGGGAFFGAQVLGDRQGGLEARWGSRDVAGGVGGEGRGEGEAGAVGDGGQGGRGGEGLAGELVAGDSQPNISGLTG